MLSSMEMESPEPRVFNVRIKAGRRRSVGQVVNRPMFQGESFALGLLRCLMALDPVDAHNTCLMPENVIPEVRMGSWISRWRCMVLKHIVDVAAVRDELEGPWEGGNALTDRENFSPLGSLDRARDGATRGPERGREAPACSVANWGIVASAICTQNGVMMLNSWWVGEVRLS